MKAYPKNSDIAEQGAALDGYSAALHGKHVKVRVKSAEALKTLKR